jgi:hypothetical protein
MEVAKLGLNKPSLKFKLRESGFTVLSAGNTALSALSEFTGDAFAPCTLERTVKVDAEIRERGIIKVTQPVEVPIVGDIAPVKLMTETGAMTEMTT